MIQIIQSEAHHYHNPSLRAITCLLRLSERIRWSVTTALRHLGQTLGHWPGLSRTDWPYVLLTLHWESTQHRPASRPYDDRIIMHWDRSPENSNQYNNAPADPMHWGWLRYNSRVHFSPADQTVNNSQFNESTKYFYDNCENRSAQFTCLSIHDSINLVNNLFHSMSLKKYFFL